MTFEWQETPIDIEGYTDADWAGCRYSRKSTSGGVILRGVHPIQWWSKTQTIIALSSGEAELYGTVKTAAETLGAAAALRDVGEDHGGRIWADASAALGIIHRRGLGKVRHLDTHCLWIQEVAAKKKLLFSKVKGADNYADLLTKHLDHGTMRKHCEGLKMEFPKHQSESALKLDNLRRTKGQEGEGEARRVEEES